MRVDEAIIAIGRTKGMGRGFVTLPPYGSLSRLKDIGCDRFCGGSREVPGMNKGRSK